MDLLGAVLLQRSVDIVRDFGDEELVRRLGQDARDVEGDVAYANDGDRFGGKIPVTLEVGVAVVEADELAGAVVTLEILARNAQGLIGGGAGGEDDRVIIIMHLVDGEIAADLNIS